MPEEPPDMPTTAGRDAGAEAVGGGSGALWIAERRCGGTDPVFSCAGAWACERNGLLNREVSELQLTAATEIVARMAKRNTDSERPGSTTRRIGFPTRTQQDGWGVNKARVNKRLRMRQP